MYDIIDVIKNLQTLSDDNSSFKVLKDFERVLDTLDIYVFKNWSEGELIEGPVIKRYTVTCKFMWDLKEMPDPDGAKTLYDYGCQVQYQKSEILIPRKIKEPDDFRPGTKKGKIDAYPIWIVSIEMPKKLMQDVYVGKDNKENNSMAEIMRYSSKQNLPTEMQQEVSDEEPQT